MQHQIRSTRCGNTTGTRNACRRAAYITFVNSSWGRSSCRPFPCPFFAFSPQVSTCTPSGSTSVLELLQSCCMAQTCWRSGNPSGLASPTVVTKIHRAVHAGVVPSSHDPLRPCSRFAVLFAICIMVQALKQRMGWGCVCANSRSYHVQ